MTPQWTEIAGAAFSLAYLLLAVRGHAALWVLGIISSAAYVAVCLQSKIYGDMILQAYYVCISAYGLWRWLRPARQTAEPADRSETSGPAGRSEPSDPADRSDRSDRSDPAEPAEPAEPADPSDRSEYSDCSEPADRSASPCHTPRRQWPAIAAATLLVWAAWSLALGRLTDSPVPLLDALTTALCITGTWMLTRRHVENWLVFILADALSVGLYLGRGLPLTAALYAVYTLVAVSGYLRWRRAAAPARIPARG